MHSQPVPPLLSFLCPSQVETSPLQDKENKKLLLPQPPSPQPPTCQQPDTPQSHKALKCKVIIVAAFLFAELLAVLRTTVLIILAYTLPRSCATNGTLNSSDCAQSSRIRKWIGILSCCWVFIRHIFLHELAQICSSSTWSI